MGTTVWSTFEHGIGQAMQKCHYMSSIRRIPRNMRTHDRGLSYRRNPQEAEVHFLIENSSLQLMQETMPKLIRTRRKKMTCHDLQVTDISSMVIIQVINHRRFVYVSVQGILRYLREVALCHDPIRVNIQRIFNTFGHRR